MVEDRFKNDSRPASVATLVYGYDKELSFWAAQKLGIDSFDVSGNYRAIGVMYNGDIIASVVYYNYRHPNIEMSVASISPRWSTRLTLKGIFDYPFNQLGCSRATVLVDKENTKSRSLVERLGYVQEGILREAHPTGDAILYGMLKRECKWITENGFQRKSKSANAA